MSERLEYLKQVPESIRREAAVPTEIAINAGETSAKIAPEKGGLVTRFSVGGKEIIYFDTEAFDDLENKKPKMGVPILAPFAGTIQKDTKLQHGGVREVPWVWRDHENDSTTIAINSGQLPEEMRKELKRIYGDDFEYETEIKVSVSEGKLTYVIKIKNNSLEAKEFAPGLHPYFVLPNEQRDEIVTNLRDFDISKMDQDHPQKYDMPEGGAIVTLGNRTLTVIGSEEFKNVVVWGLDGADSICLEPFVAKPSERSEYITLEPQEEKTLEVTFEIK